LKEKKETKKDVALLSLDGITVSFPLPRTPPSFKRRRALAVDDVSLEISKGERLGIVGPSGCGKTTLALTALVLQKPDTGKVCLEGVDLTTLSNAGLRPYRKRMQIVFQSPSSSLHPRMKVGRQIEEPLRVHKNLQNKKLFREKAVDLMQSVSLRASDYEKYPHELSGGQKQRVSIARALAIDPEMLIADEPTSALDASVQAHVLTLLKQKAASMNLALLYISHDLRLVRWLCHSVAVMFKGRIVERASVESLWNDPLHPYTQTLVEGAMKPPTSRNELDVLSAHLEPTGHGERCCIYQRQCKKKGSSPLCPSARPRLKEVAPGHWVACHFQNSG
jgi:oligopeptide/dipeptide ABC transporter ATP-binding protein